MNYKDFVKDIDPFGDGEGLPEKYHKYEHTINDKNNIFFKWRDGIDNETEKDFKRHKIFDVPEPIEWYCSKVPTGETKQVQMPTRDEPVTINETTDSGYVKPKFKFIGIRLSGLRDRKKEYRKGLDLFGLGEDEEVSPDIVSSISNYKDTLHKQLQRQIDKIKEIDHEIKRILKVFYHETKQNIVKEEHSDLTEEQRDRRGEAWKKLINGINHLYYVITIGENADRVESHRVFDNEFAEDVITESTIYGVTKLVKEKQPYLDVAENIARLVSSLESIQEDAILYKKTTNGEAYQREANRELCWSTANDFCENAKNVEYLVETIAFGMEVGLEHPDVTNMSKLARIVKGEEEDKNGEFLEPPEEINSSTNRDTIVNWIDQIDSKAGIKRTK